MKGKNRRGRKKKPINYDIGPAYKATAGSAAARRRILENKMERDGVKLDLKREYGPDGKEYTRSVDSSPAYNQGGVITGVSPLIILAQKLSEMMKGEKEQPIVLRQTDKPTPRTQSPYIPTAEEAKNYTPADSTESSKQKDVLTNLVVAGILKGKR